jgi:hypothetical protein
MVYQEVLNVLDLAVANVEIAALVASWGDAQVRYRRVLTSPHVPHVTPVCAHATLGGW